MRRTWTDEQLREAVPSSCSYTEVIAKLNLSTTSPGNWKTVQKYIKLLDLDTSHFVSRYSAANIEKAQLANKIPIEEILVENSTYSTHHLLKRLVEAKLKECKCEECGIWEWRGEKIPLEVDHVNGINNDHRIENLKVLCPNCHSLTPTWRGRKNKKVYTCSCGNVKVKSSKVCASCSKSIPRKTKIEWPDVEEVVLMLRDSNFRQVGVELGVSDNAVRKFLTRELGSANIENVGR